eukprot:1378573-Pyramimonas_sp.AAC.1
MRLFRDMCAPCIPRGHAFAVRSYDFPCTCNELGSLLGVPLPVGGHVRARAENSTLNGSIPRHFHYDGLCAWSRGHVMNCVDESMEAVVHRRVKAGVHVNWSASDVHAYLRELHCNAYDFRQKGDS